MNCSENHNPVIVIMAKTPREGSVKTRLRPVLTDAQCAALAACFLHDAFTKARKITPNVIVAFAPADGAGEIENLLPEKTMTIAQIGSDLGERMNSAAAFAESAGFSPIIITGTDSPDLPPETIISAIEAFRKEETKIVLGASADGGYYLIGLRRKSEEVFENVEWSSEKTFRQTAANARGFFGCDITETASWYDVDTPADLKILYEHSLNDPDFAKTAPQTAVWLEKAASGGKIRF